MSKKGVLKAPCPPLQFPGYSCVREHKAQAGSRVAIPPLSVFPESFVVALGYFLEGK